jgi:hypothetical protein
VAMKTGARIVKEVEVDICETHLDGQGEDDGGEDEHSLRTEDAGSTVLWAWIWYLASRDHDRRKTVGL